MLSVCPPAADVPWLLLLALLFLDVWGVGVFVGVRCEVGEDVTVLFDEGLLMPMVGMEIACNGCLLQLLGDVHA